VEFQDSLKVVVDASCSAYAAQGDDEVGGHVLWQLTSGGLVCSARVVVGYLSQGSGC
jgi:hypothetical protein